MMKYPKLLILPAVIAGLFNMLAPQTVQARIGESQQVLERRLLSSGGIVYRDDAVETSRKRGAVYLPFTDYMPSGATLRVYFKSADGRRPKSSDQEAKSMTAGWDLHVIYVRGVSVFEYYKRSQGLNTFEFNQLLAIQAGSSYWTKVNPKELPEDTPPSAFGYDMALNNGAVRGKKLGGNAVLFVDAEFDAGLARARTTAFQEDAPTSVNGF